MTSASSAAEKSRRPAWLVLLAVTLLLALHHALAVGSKLHQSTTSAANPALPPALQFIRAWETIDANIGAQGKILRVLHAIDLETLQFGRLCHLLGDRAPDAFIGGSLLVFRVSDAEVQRALYRPLAP